MTLGGRRFLLAMAIVGASVCLALGISLPIIKLTKFVFFTTEHSLISTVSALLGSGQMFLGLTVLVFSIVLPILKLLYLLLLSTLPQLELTRAARQLRALEWLGKWSMHDVLVLSLTIFFIKSQGVYDASSLNGVYFFTAAILFMILAYTWLNVDATGTGAKEAIAAAPVEPPRSAPFRNFVLSFLIIIATVCFALGIFMPAIKFTTVFVWKNEHSILSMIPIFFSSAPQASAFLAPTAPSGFGKNFGQTKSEMPRTPDGASGKRASTRCTMFSVRSCSPAEMKIFVP